MLILALCFAAYWIIKQLKSGHEDTYLKQSSREAAQWKKLQQSLGTKRLQSAFHTVNDLTLKGKSDQSEEFISNFTHFTEQTILLAKRDFIPLDSEIDLLTTYLNMIRIQVREFNFKIISSVEIV